MTISNYLETRKMFYSLILKLSLKQSMFLWAKKTLTLFKPWFLPLSGFHAHPFQDITPGVPGIPHVPLSPRCLLTERTLNSRFSLSAIFLHWYQEVPGVQSSPGCPYHLWLVFKGNSRRSVPHVAAFCTCAVDRTKHDNVSKFLEQTHFCSFELEYSWPSGEMYRAI